ncbi:MAG: hypothetical protein NC124_17280 [Clostridium sp.]|nr:hypothetical protein [Clostridium sp.]
MKHKIAAVLCIIVFTVFSAYVSVQAAGDDDAQNYNEKTKEEIYYDLLIAQESRERAYAVYRNQVKAQLAELQIDYLSKLQAELEQKYIIEEEKLELGYTTPVAVEEAKSSYLAVGLQIQTAEEQRDFYKDSIRLNGGEYRETGLTDHAESLKADYLSDFRENSAQRAYYDQQIQYYNDILQKGAGNGAEPEIIQKQIELYQLQKEQYEADLEIYVKGLLVSYHAAERQISEMDSRIAVTEKKIGNALLLFEEGKIAEIQLTELQTELQRLGYERASLVGDEKLIYYKLTHTVESREGE